ncbi:MAG: cytochrome c1 [Alphaproteobacteria bacterium]
MKKIIFLFLMMLMMLTPQLSGAASTKTSKLDRQSWSWTGALGKYDKASAQRGLQIYTQVCAGCHSLNLLPFRTLEKIGYSKDEIKAFARTYQIEEVADDGKVIRRSGLPSDYFPEPFATEADARLANGGSYPPDLSLVVKSYSLGRGNLFLNFVDALLIQGDASGADFIYGILTGYENPPSNVVMNENMYFNKYAGQISMPPPLVDGIVSYSDGTKNDVKQMSYDVVTFLAFAAEPNLEESRYMALKFFMVLFVIYYLVYRVKKKKWRELDDY